MNSNTESIEVLAATTWAHDRGVFPSRIVLCREKNDGPNVGIDGFQYIVWMEVNPDVELYYFTSGDYADDIVGAWESFEKRSRRHLNVLHGCDYPACLNEDQVDERYAPEPEPMPLPDGVTAIVMDKDDPACVEKVYRAVAKVTGEE